jgi:hypothetical protein
MCSSTLQHALDGVLLGRGHQCGPWSDLTNERSRRRAAGDGVCHPRTIRVRALLAATVAAVVMRIWQLGMRLRRSSPRDSDICPRPCLRLSRVVSGVRFRHRSVSLGVSTRDCHHGNREITKDFGEPPRNRTENPQIKSLIGYAKTLEILRILRVRSANHGTARPIDGAQTAPTFRTHPAVRPRSSTHRIPITRRAPRSSPDPT